MSLRVEEQTAVTTGQENGNESASLCEENV